MATTPPRLDPSAQRLAQTYRASQLALRAETIRAVIGLWPLLRFGSLNATYTRWLEAMRLLVERDRSSGYATTTGYLTGAYLLAGNAGVPEIPSLPALDPEQFATSARVTSLVAYRRGLSLGMTNSQASDNALVQISGAASRLVLEASRATVLEAAGSNDARWGRIAADNACPFCKLLAGRGFVYREATVDFAAHDHCGCTSVIDFSVAA